MSEKRREYFEVIFGIVDLWGVIDLKTLGKEFQKLLSVTN
jgi:hypothetical protein